MCGILGIYSKRNIDLDFFNEVLDSTLLKRGPDDKGIYNDDKIVLGHRRLSIIDLSSGQQPIFNEDSSKIIIFNGEIYNYRELRSDLQKKGHKFKTNSDTEVIIHLHEEYPINEAINKLNGIFSYAIWDKHKEELLLVRDRFGVKPLYYRQNGDELIFASQANAVIRLMKESPSIDAISLQQYLFFEYVPAPRSIYKDIKKLPAGHYLLFKKGRGEINRYYTIKQLSIENNEDQILQKLEALISNSAKYQLISDVPIGIFLSGGIDSSLLAYYAQMHHQGQLNTFSISFEESSYDESRWFSLVADKLGVKNYVKQMKADEGLGVLQNVVEQLDEPFGDPSLLPTYILSKFARERVKVVLSGDGPDELFGGYPTYFAHEFAPVYRMMPAMIKKLISFMADTLPISHKNLSLDFILKRFIQGYEYDPRIQHQVWMGGFSPKELQKLTIAKIEDDLLFEPIFSKKIRDFLDQDFQLYLQDDLLFKTDRASMFNSLEVRVPYLDHNIVEYAYGLPYKYKVRGIKTKYILRKLASKYFPRTIFSRPKKGFGIPVSKWLKNELKEVFMDNLAEGNSFFNKDYVLKLYDLHLSDKANCRKQLWLILIFNLWFSKQKKSLKQMT